LNLELFFLDTGNRAGFRKLGMAGSVRIQLEPLHKVLEVPCGSALQDVLFAHGVEFPCGGHGCCKGCRIKVLEGSLPATSDQIEVLTPHELADGWRLACRCEAESDLILEIGQWEATILADDTSFEFVPSEGLGVAIDLGTTTLVAQLVDLRTCEVLGVRTALNPQARYGGDVMSRVQFGLNAEGAAKLRDLIRHEIGAMIAGTLGAAHGVQSQVRSVVMVGNTVMHHLFCGIDPRPLSYYPFEPIQDGLQTFDCRDLGWHIPGDPVVQFLPCLGGFVGSDILAGILATGMHKGADLVSLVDLGTNGEVVLGNKEQLLCASTAAGPAFEGARIKMGMQAATGAISEVAIHEGKASCRVLGNIFPRGICGSGLVDAVAVGLELGRILPSGRLAGGAEEWMLAEPVSLCQNDIRELQLAKGAIAAAIQILLQTLGVHADDVKTMYLAGAFGNYINRMSARRIGLIDFPPGKVVAAGNTALRGAKLALFQGSAPDLEYSVVRDRIRHLSLAADPHFQRIYVESMFFPENG
jgi:uncharacterized 2Fe-2S/4Fe-4S cluster protein (DUF4445 family)